MATITTTKSICKACDFTFSMSRQFSAESKGEFPTPFVTMQSGKKSVSVNGLTGKSDLPKQLSYVVKTATDLYKLESGKLLADVSVLTQDTKALAGALTLDWLNALPDDVTFKFYMPKSGDMRAKFNEESQVPTVESSIVDMRSAATALKLAYDLTQELAAKLQEVANAVTNMQTNRINPDVVYFTTTTTTTGRGKAGGVKGYVNPFA